MALRAPELADIEAARGRIAGAAIRTPLIRLAERGLDREIWLKLETLQPVGSFKLRGACNCIRSAAPETLADGVYTASAGNMAQGVAWMARELGLPARVFVPDYAPEAKVAAIKALGAGVEKIPFDAWWAIMMASGKAGEPGCFVHPVCDTAVMAGNGTIGLEIAEDLADIDAVVVPFGGGGLVSGIAAALRAKAPDTKVFACEVETAPPLAAALAAGEPTTVEFRRSFVDGIGSAAVLPVMWPILQDLVAGSVVVPLTEVEAAIRRLIARLHVIAEGAGATALAAAMSPQFKGQKVVCIISGSGLNFAELVRIMG